MATKFPDESDATGDNLSECEKVTEDSCKIVEEMADVPDALAEIRVHDLLAVDCEGVNLGRSGELTVLTIAIPNKTFIFDVLKLGKHVFDDGLRDVLEDKNTEKLMFDCRRDADSLYHQFQVNISGVLDLQLLEVMHRRKPGTSLVKSASGSRRSTRTDDVESIYGFLRCMELYLSDKEIIKKKKQGQDLLECDKDIWKTRPLTDLLKTYCCIDTTELFSLYEKLKADDDSLSRLRIASSRYADCLRSMSVRTNGIYENHAYLPLDIIPDEGSTSFPFASTKCVGCHRLFPRDEFSKTQLKNGEQKCRVCKKVKLKADVQNNREADWMRDDCTPELYYSSDENRWADPYHDYEDLYHDYEDVYDYGYEDIYHDDDW
ncbi:piRNA biogenesis protein EXD1-like [Argopecten irradians]|uniref:piRNA biogenesis protein EXD1-like n=1 Tax=Argopecten irradians TaxID=31199 RepID=UPI0037236ACD